MHSLFRFPDPVNEVAARTVAAGALVLAVAFLATGEGVFLLLLAYGFVARVATGPTLSPLGQLATRVIAPRLSQFAKPVPGPPKRFAQGIGAVVTTSAAVAWFGFGAHGVAQGLAGAIVIAAGLESIFAFCIGCKIFAVLMRTGIVPESVCERCNNLAV